MNKLLYCAFLGSLFSSLVVNSTDLTDEEYIKISKFISQPNANKLPPAWTVSSTYYFADQVDLSNFSVRPTIFGPEDIDMYLDALDQSGFVQWIVQESSAQRYLFTLYVEYVEQATESRNIKISFGKTLEMRKAFSPLLPEKPSKR